MGLLSANLWIQVVGCQQCAKTLPHPTHSILFSWELKEGVERVPRTAGWGALPAYDCGSLQFHMGTAPSPGWLGGREGTVCAEQPWLRR